MTPEGIDALIALVKLWRERSDAAQYRGLRGDEEAARYGFTLRDCANELEHALAAAHGWQPIETAPKDGTVRDDESETV
jgi:hypothetical protein